MEAISSKKRKFEKMSSNKTTVNTQLLQHIYQTNSVILSEISKLSERINKLDDYINNEDQYIKQIDSKDKEIRILKRKLEQKNEKYDYFA